MKQELFAILGSVCERCGFADARALQIDHLDGGGNQEHRDFGNARNMYQFYRRNAGLARQRLQVLCANCNWIKKSEKREDASRKTRPPHFDAAISLRRSAEGAKRANIVSVSAQQGDCSGIQSKKS
jgi:hypothetical protein